MKKKILHWIRVHKCDHKFVFDIQISVIECIKCGEKYHFTYHDIYNKDVRKSLNMKKLKYNEAVNQLLYSPAYGTGHRICARNVR